MKHLIIIATLTGVVLIASLAVFFVEGITTPIIDDYNLQQANIAKFEVLPDLTTDDDITPTDVYDFTGTSITELIIIEGKGYIYTAKFQGFQSVITYIVGMDLAGNITGYKTLTQGDTPGLGALIAEEDFFQQFTGMKTSDAAAGNFDGLAGATITTGGLIGSLEKLIQFHNVEFEGVVVETDAERLLRLKEEITEVGLTFTDISSSYDLTTSPISKVESTNDNQVVYTVTVDGYNPGIIYLVAFDLSTNDIIGFRVIEQSETIGLGAIIEDETFQAQFDDLGQDEIDSIAGSTAAITLGAIKDSLEDVVVFHQTEFEGTVAETDAEKLLRYKQEITVTGAVLTDVSADYDLVGSIIDKVELANDGTDDVAVIYTVVFVGYNTGDVIEYIISFDLETNDIIGFRIVYQNETPGYGDAIEDEDYYLQFVGMAQIDALNGDIDDVAGTSGAPVTTTAFKVSLNTVVVFHKAEFEGVVVESDAERLARLWLELFPTASYYTKVTRDYDAHYDIEEFYEVYNEFDVYLGNIYHVKSVGASYSEETYLEFFLGIAPDKTFTGLRMWDDNETPGKTTDFYLPEYGNTYTGDDIEADFTIDDIAGSTITNNALQETALAIAIYHVEQYLGEQFARPANQEAELAQLIQAFPSAVSFNSVYLNYEYDSNIYNIYEALDGTDTVLGYVYYGSTTGNNGTIEFTWGVNLVGLTQQLQITSESETWENAETYGTYDGSAGYFPDIAWLDNFEGVTFSSLITTQVDSIAGVTNTTESLRDVLEGIAEYHSDESIGGAG